MENRSRLLNNQPHQTGPVIYWMSRDQRVQDNWSLLFASQMADRHQSPLAVVFCLQDTFLGATARQYSFMLDGLQEVESTLHRLGIPFFLRQGNPVTVMPQFLAEQSAGALVTDFDPLKIKRSWKEAVLREIKIAAYEVDSHNIIPCWQASQKQEYGAYTIRPKIHRLLPLYLKEIPPLTTPSVSWPESVNPVDWHAVTQSVTVNSDVRPVSWIQAGELAAKAALDKFIHEKLDHYSDNRNDPTKNGTSRLSPYFHFGHLSAQRAALSVMNSGPITTSKEVFLEELIVRRELADNYCWYNPNYDSLSSVQPWALKTLDAHRSDIRPYVYSLQQMEQGLTHDDLWNAAQNQLLTEGIIHGYLRMYWAKKILEWTPDPKTAWEIALYLNDKYALDGRDPNGYTGIGWSIGGVHDRPWFNRQIFGNIRYMSYNGCKSKFNIRSYIEKYRAPGRSLFETTQQEDL